MPFEENHRQLHERHRSVDPGDDVEEKLGDWRIDGVGVIPAIDVVEEILIGAAKEGERRIPGNVAIRRDVGVLHDAIPGVPVDVR